MPNKIGLPGNHQAGTNPAVPKDAATVILVRQTDHDSWELFLARRNRRQSFMAGAFVFPGGQLEDSDSDSGLADFTAAKKDMDHCLLLQDKSIDADKARGLFIAAIRETFEEVGILLGGNSPGNFISFREPDTLKRFTTHRRELNNSQLTLKEMASRENIFFFSDALIPYAHWITPEIEKMRFSARFFLARLPEEQTPVPDQGELAESLWVAPKKALEMHYTGKILLMPPTLKTIEEISIYSGIDELFAAAVKRVIYPIMPQLAEGALLLPHDPEYSINDYKRPPNLHEPSRVIIHDGVWKTTFFNR